MNPTFQVSHPATRGLRARSEPRSLENALDTAAGSRLSFARTRLQETRSDPTYLMKKLAIGCGVVVLLLAVGAAVGSYLVYRKVSTTFSGFAELARVPDLERSVRKSNWSSLIERCSRTMSGSRSLVCSTGSIYSDNKVRIL